MSATKTLIDVDVLRDEIEKTYTDVSTDPDRDFIFPTGRSWAQDLGYPEPELMARCCSCGIAEVSAGWIETVLRPGKVGIAAATRPRGAYG